MDVEDVAKLVVIDWLSPATLWRPLFKVKSCILAPMTEMLGMQLQQSL
jgi:hypothetical protein